MGVGVPQLEVGITRGVGVFTTAACWPGLQGFVVRSVAPLVPETMPTS